MGSGPRVMLSGSATKKAGAAPENDCFKKDIKASYRALLK